MASSSESNESAPAGSWTLDKLKECLHKHKLSVSGIKAELVSRVRVFRYSFFFEASQFQQFNC